ncbi:unnamed protein product [Schistosoma mattheei]|uniref:Uncharacterized protein n=1 Tax=Schistosoma mattheei TaxID=31246 RepID=A0A183NZM3_9TREM|nr:unnamed protein product [Schistosoma mattheei]
MERKHRKSTINKIMTTDTTVEYTHIEMIATGCLATKNTAYEFHIRNKQLGFYEQPQFKVFATSNSCAPVLKTNVLDNNNNNNNNSNNNNNISSSNQW